MEKEQEKPTRLCKFRPINQHTADVFLNKRLFFGYVDDFNDPFEFSLNASETDYRARQPRIYHSFRNRFTTFCASDEETKNDILLWSHYAQNHHGICIEFTPHYEDDKSPFHRLVVVKYCEAIPVLPSEYRDEDVKAIFTTKAACWKYEKEWRIIQANDVGETIKRDLPSGLTVDRGRFNNFSASELSKVILGCKSSKEDERVVMNWVRELGNSKIVVEKCLQDEKEYRLEFVRIM